MRRKAEAAERDTKEKEEARGRVTTRIGERQRKELQKRRMRRERAEDKKERGNREDDGRERGEAKCDEGEQMGRERV